MGVHCSSNKKSKHNVSDIIAQINTESFSRISTEFTSESSLKRESVAFELANSFESKGENEINLGEIKLLFSQAKEYCQKEEDVKAIDYYKEVIALYTSLRTELNKDGYKYKIVSKDLLVAYKLLGEIYNRLGRYCDEAEVFSQAINLDKKNPEPYCWLAVVYEKQENIKEAINMFLEAIELDHINLPLYNHIGSLCLKEKKYEEAAKIYKKCITIDNSKKFYHKQLSLVNKLITQKTE